MITTRAPDGANKDLVEPEVVTILRYFLKDGFPLIVKMASTRRRYAQTICPEFEDQLGDRY